MEPASKKTKVEELSKFGNRYYPYDIDNKTIISKYINREDLKPINVLEAKLNDTKANRNKIDVGDSIAHLFLRDFRTIDNKGLSIASELATKKEKPLITFHIFCLEDFDAHSVSPFKLEYMLRSLEVLKKDLREMNIPLVSLQVEKRKDVATKIAEFLEQNNTSHVFCNMEYEVDELRLLSRLVSILLDKRISFNPVHDSCIVKPGELKTKSKGTQYAVFTPWYKAWCNYLKTEEAPFMEYPRPHANESFPDPNKLFDSEIPQVPESKRLTHDQQKEFDTCWKCGEHEAWMALRVFLESDKFKKYDESRNEISEESVSRMSCPISSGIISTRSIIRYILENKFVKKIDNGEQGTGWIRQIAWRDFYRHILCNWPYVCMFKPFLLEYDDLKWEYNSDHFYKWCQGKTGFPIVDAAMRQLNQTGYLHNRCRMIVASFLSKHLLIDWKYGEYYFMEHLIDGDFASNNGGWGFSSSTGVDPQPYFRIFNPWLQSERFDKKGTYIRRWVPELKDIQDEKGIHNPYEKGYGHIAEKNGYPKPIVDHKYCRERALNRFKDAKY